MAYRVYFGRPLYLEVEPSGVELDPYLDLGGDKNSCALTIGYSHKLHFDLSHHKTTGILIDSVTVDLLQGSTKALLRRLELYTVTVNSADPDFRAQQLYVKLSFDRKEII